MFRYLNPVRIFRSKQTVHPTESLHSDPTPSPTKPDKSFRRRNIQTRAPEPAKSREKRIRFADQKSSEGGSEPYDGEMMISTRKKAKTTSAIGKLRLKSSDGELFEVDGEMMVASSERIKGIVEGSGYCSGEVIGVPEVAGDVMAIAIEYCEKQRAVAAKEEERGVDADKEWAEALFRADQSTFFDLTLAAYHLKIESLMDLSCETVANMIRGKSPTEMNRILKIQGDSGDAALFPPSNEVIAK